MSRPEFVPAEDVTPCEWAGQDRIDLLAGLLEWAREGSRAHVEYALAALTKAESAHVVRCYRAWNGSAS